MKKRFLILLAMLVLAVSLLTVTAFAADPITKKCEFCGEEKQWQPVGTAAELTAVDADGHYYISAGFTMGAKTFSGINCCLDLNGKTLTANRGFIVKEGATVNIQGSGKITGRGLSSNSVATVSVAWVQSNSTLNLKNVTVAYEDMESRKATPYGQFRIDGNLSLDGCTVAGGETEGKGGAIYVGPNAQATLVSTSVAAGTAAEGACIYNAGKLTVSGNTSAANVLMAPAENSPALAQMLTLGASFTGSAELTLPGTVTGGDAIATVENGASVANVTCSNPSISLETANGQLAIKAGDVAAIGSTTYTNLSQALADIQEGQTLQLLAYAPALTLEKNITLDLCGCSVGALEIAEGKTVLVKDTATDDYNISDDIYGKIGSVEGAAEAVSGYMAIQETDGVSYHAYKMEITGMTLRAPQAGIYFNSDFLGDSLVQEQIASFGVAMSVYGEPTEATLTKNGQYTSFDASVFNQDSKATSSVVYGVVKDTVGAAANDKNAQMQIYGRPYIKFTDGTVLMGQTKNRSFKDQVMEINDYKEDLSWLNQTQWEEAVDFFRAFPKLLDDWGAANFRKAFQTEEDKTLKVVAITSSFGLNTTQLLADIAMAEGVENIVVARIYTAACTLEKHVNYLTNDTPGYEYTKCVNGKWTTVKEATMLYGLEDEYWDVIYMQQSAAESPLPETYKTFVTTIRGYVDAHIQNPNAKFIWNMTWAYQNDSTSSVFVNTFKGDQMAMYEANVNAVLTKILPRNDFDAIIPSGTAIQNARNSYFGDALTKDTYHLNNLGRAIAGYTLYATLMGLEDPGFRLDHISLNEAGGWELPKKITLSDQDKLVIKECVNNALDHPYEVTASSFPTAE